MRSTKTMRVLTVLFWTVAGLLLSKSCDAFLMQPRGVFRPRPRPSLGPWVAPNLIRPSSTSRSASLSPTDVALSPLTTYFLETLIRNGVPAVLTLLVIAFAAKVLFRRGDRKESDWFDNPSSPAATLYNDLYGDQEQSSSQPRPSVLRRLLGASSSETPPKNIGVPGEQYLRLTHLNQKLASYRYSMQAAVASKATAAKEYRQAQAQRALGQALVSLSPSQWRELQELEQDFLKSGTKLVEELTTKQAEWAAHLLDEELDDMGLESVYQLDPVPANRTASKRKKASKAPEPAIAKLQTDLAKLELDFVRDVLRVVGVEAAAGVRAAWLGDWRVRGLGRLVGELSERPLTALLSETQRPPTLYVARFPGDALASQVAELREEVTAIVENAKPGDEALVVLQTGGGTVTGYGLAAAQLLRLKEAGLRLTIAVEQVAASGGYMMCCVADHIVASPFAVLGSIGVITDIPNFYERLKEEGIEFQTVTAGKYKRTLTPTKKPTKEDFAKTKADVEEILVLFRDFVAENRPQLDIDKVATGETWFGKDALDRNLCDEIKTVDSVLLEFVAKGFNVFEVEYQPPVETPFGKLVPAVGHGDNVIRKGLRWLVRTIAEEVDAELGIKQRPITERYLVENNDAERIRTES